VEISKTYTMIELIGTRTAWSSTVIGWIETPTSATSDMIPVPNHNQEQDWSTAEISSSSTATIESNAGIGWSDRVIGWNSTVSSSSNTVTSVPVSD